MGKEMAPQRLDVYSDNIFLGNWHVVGVAEFSETLKNMLDATGKYKCHRDLSGNLGVVVNALYVRDCREVTEQSVGKGNKSRYVIYRTLWNGTIGGCKETVVAVFHIHHEHATSGSQTRWDRYGKGTLSSTASSTSSPNTS